MTFAAALDAIDEAFAEPVRYTGAGLVDAEITVVWMDVSGDPFQGVGNTTRTIGCEVRKAKLPQRPGKNDRLVRNGVAWAVSQIVDRDDVGAWTLVLGRA